MMILLSLRKMKLLVIGFLFVAVQASALEESTPANSFSFTNLCFGDEIQKYQDGKEDEMQTSSIPTLDLPVEKTAIFQTLQEILTPETVKKGMEAFINLSKNQTVEDSHFFEVMQSAADKDNRDTGGVPQFVEKYLETWCQNGKPNVPYPGVIINRVNSTHVWLNQAVITASGQNGTGIKWFIPVRLVTGEGTTLWVWLENNGKPKVVPYPESSAWILVDSKLVPALHRASIQEKLEVQLNQNYSVLSESQRVKLIWEANLFYHARQNIDIHSFLNVTRYMAHDRSLLVWKEYVKLFFIYAPPSHPDFPIVQKYFNKQLDIALAAVTEEAKTEPEERPLKNFLFNEAVRRSSPFAVEMGRKALKEWKAEGKQEEVKKEDLRLLLLAAGEEDFKYFYNPETITLQMKRMNIFPTLSNLLVMKNYIAGGNLILLGNLYNKSKLEKKISSSRILQEALNYPPVYPLRASSFPAKKEQVLFTFLGEKMSKIPTEEVVNSLNSFQIASKEQLDEKLQFVNKHLETFSKEEKEMLNENLQVNKKGLPLLENVIQDMVNWVSLQE